MTRKRMNPGRAARISWSKPVEEHHLGVHLELASHQAFGIIAALGGTKFHDCGHSFNPRSPSVRHERGPSSRRLKPLRSRVRDDGQRQRVALAQRTLEPPETVGALNHAFERAVERLGVFA